MSTMTTTDLDGVVWNVSLAPTRWRWVPCLRGLSRELRRFDICG